ncbi:hypothetical protein AJ80_08736 [Polytolypa hystricis UAMH7299]|uniref:HNH nuclease domain-containing protein n=1 Tax=Polytolypa hystricis (strain UAMH7299) TaxID=1447883 RepID=A0A2B7X2Y3_POLH7|nr:hypothetical protein AJ80_08736 [Polytolypa hystricis UAMH7299]
MPVTPRRGRRLAGRSRSPMPELPTQRRRRRQAPTGGKKPPFNAPNTSFQSPPEPHQPRQLSSGRVLFTVELTDEDALVRPVSRLSSATTHAAFTNAAAHVFPLAYSALWPTLGFNSAITIPGPQGDNINSVQNGILLQSHIHQLFDIYHFSICTKSNYKVVYFMPDISNIAGTHLSPEFLSNPQRPPDELLDWHFRQAVLSNMKADGQPIFEHDFNPGEDMMGQILRGPKPQQRMEFELFMRLGHR